MELFTRETIGNYTSDPYAKNDHKYSKEMQEVRKELSEGKKITFFKNKLYIDPVCNDEKIESHKKFLLKNDHIKNIA